MGRDRLIQIVAALGIIVGLLTAGGVLPVINASASEAQLKYTNEAAAGAPTPVVIAQNIGIVRGVVSNYLWIRADKLKEDGKFFEAYQLSRWITQLQPRFAQVWQFHSWNMAYNISVSTHTRQERWQWVNDGIQLLRNHGIRYNPNEMMLYRELAWFFLHKVAGYTDDAHKYYKQQLADEWQALLGAPPFGYEERMDEMRKVARAPDRWDGVLDAEPKAAALAAELRRANLNLDAELLRSVETLRAIGASEMSQRMELKSRLDAIEDVSSLPKEAQDFYRPLIALRPILNDPEHADAWPIVLSHIRKRRLIDHYNMDPGYMVQAMEEFGPLDWRAPASHGLYWAAVGVERGVTRINQTDFDRINTDRVLFHSEQNLKRIGRVYYDFATKECNWGPDLRFIPFYEKTFLLMLDRLRINPGQDPETFRSGYRNFLVDAVREYYMFGEYEKAQEKYDQLRNSQDFFHPEEPDRFTYPLDEFILREVTRGDRYASIHVAKNDVLALLVTAYRDGMGRRSKKVFDSNWNLAKSIYDYFQVQVGNPGTALTPDEGRLAFVWNDVVVQAFQIAMTDPTSTMGQRIALWETADPSLKLVSYDVIRGALQEWLAESRLPLTMDEAFPPPPGLEEYRKAVELENADPTKNSGNIIERK